MASVGNLIKNSDWSNTISKLKSFQTRYNVPDSAPTHEGGYEDRDLGKVRADLTAEVAVGHVTTQDSVGDAYIWITCVYEYDRLPNNIYWENPFVDIAGNLMKPDALSAIDYNISLFDNICNHCNDCPEYCAGYVDPSDYGTQCNKAETEWCSYFWCGHNRINYFSDMNTKKNGERGRIGQEGESVSGFSCYPLETWGTAGHCCDKFYCSTVLVATCDFHGCTCY